MRTQCRVSYSLYSCGVFARLSLCICRPFSPVAVVVDIHAAAPKVFCVGHSLLPAVVSVCTRVVEGLAGAHAGRMRAATAGVRHVGGSVQNNAQHGSSGESTALPVAKSHIQVVVPSEKEAKPPAG